MFIIIITCLTCLLLICLLVYLGLFLVHTITLANLYIQIKYTKPLFNGYTIDLYDLKPIWIMNISIF